MTTANINHQPKNAEAWASIDLFKNYEVSTLGRVRNVNSGKILKPQLKTNGYFAVILCENGKVYNKCIHRLIGQTFIEKDNENYDVVDHINRDKTDNTIDNLRWVDNSINAINSKKRTVNTTGNTGVYFDKSHNRWRSSWCDENGKQHNKSFACNKYPNAKQLAIDYRNKITNSVEKYKIALQL